MKKIYFVVLLLFASFNSYAVTYYVNASATGSNNGLSWDNAFTDLQSALSVAVYGDQIWVAAGTYKAGTSRSNHFFMKDGVSIYGAFNGTETSISERDLDSNPTTLSGDIGQLGTKNDNSTKIVVVQLLTADIVIDGFRIISGYDNSGSGRGAGMYFFDNTGANITVRNCYFYDNYSYYDGGAVHIKTSTVTFEDCEFVSNSSSYNGGGAIYASNGSNSNVYIYDSTFIGNTGDSPVIRFDGPELIMDRCLISDNVANERDVIWISNSAGKFTLSNSLVIGNSTAQAFNSIISSYPSGENSVNLINVTICHNKDYDGTGGSDETVRSANSAMNIYNSIIYGNNGDNGVQVNTGNNVKNSIIEGGYSGGQNVLDESPIFVNPGSLNISPFNANNYNYHLTDNSPGVNYGDNTLVSDYTMDYYKEDRIKQGTVDLGAIESNHATLSDDIVFQSNDIVYDFNEKTIHINNFTEYKNETLKIYSIQGKLVREYNLLQNASIKLSLKSSGIYLLQIGDFKVKKILYTH